MLRASLTVGTKMLSFWRSLPHKTLLSVATRSNSAGLSYYGRLKEGNYAALAKVRLAVLEYELNRGTQQEHFNKTLKILLLVSPNRCVAS